MILPNIWTNEHVPNHKPDKQGIAHCTWLPAILNQKFLDKPRLAGALSHLVLGETTPVRSSSDVQKSWEILGISPWTMLIFRRLFFSENSWWNSMIHSSFEWDFLEIRSKFDGSSGYSGYSWKMMTLRYPKNIQKLHVSGACLGCMSRHGRTTQWAYSWRNSKFIYLSEVGI